MRDVGFAPLGVFPRSGKAKGSDARVRIRKQAMLEGCKSPYSRSPATSLWYILSQTDA